MTIDYNNLSLDQLENMSDEEFQKLDVSQIPDFQEQEPAQEENPSVEETVAQTEEVTQETETPAETTQPNAFEAGSEGTSNGNEAEGEGSRAEDTGSAPGENQDNQAQQPTDQTNPAQVEVAPEKTFFEKVTGKFNANGREFQITDPDDVVSLMQKGLNYNQKMAAIKPSMKLVKALQDNGIESVEDLGFLLDLKAKKPEAIAKLVQESGIDTYDLNEEKAAAYQPSVPEVSDEVINFEMTAKALEGNPSFGRVVQELGAFDDTTKQEIFKNPGLLNVLTEHVGLGYYDQIMNRLQYEQAVGRMQGVPFLQAYDTIGKAMFGAQQAQPAPTNVQTQQIPTQVINPTPVPVASTPKPVNNTARKAAAGSPGTATTSQKLNLTPDDIWNLSEEEFKKIDPKFL